MTVIYVNAGDFDFLQEAIPLIVKTHFGPSAGTLDVPVQVNAFVPTNRACIIWSDGRIEFSRIRTDGP